MKKRTQDFKVIENKSLNREYFVLKLQSDTPLPEIFPGQFAEVLVDHTPEVFLRRPISFYNADINGTVELLIQEVGKGSKGLRHYKPGDKLNLLYPLGNSFGLTDSGKVLLIGGGVGIAPLLLLGKHLKMKGADPVFLLGFRNRSLLIDRSGFERLGKVFITTDDGSAGEKGTVMDHSILKGNLSEYTKVYTCGPEVMMKAVGHFAEKNGIECEASLENTMACGFGACLCCIQKTIHGNLRVCEEGPVFNTKELIW